jgi:hypothetical protein
VPAAKLKKSVLVVLRGRSVGGVCVHNRNHAVDKLRETVLNLPIDLSRHGRARVEISRASQSEVAKRLEALAECHQASREPAGHRFVSLRWRRVLP